MMRSRTTDRVMRADTAAAVVGWLLVVLASDAHAQDPADLPPHPGDRGALTVGAAATPCDYWASAGPRPFVSALFELGVLYYRPGMAFGYGQPHYRWIGLDGHVSISQSGLSEYGGIRGVVPHFEARFGAAYHAPFSQYFLTPQSTYTREDTEVDFHAPSKYVALQAEVLGSIPMPGGALLAVLTGYGVLGVPDDLYVLEESLKVVMDPPYLWRGRLGYLAEFSRAEDCPLKVRFGAAAEVIHIVGREQVVVRVGPLLNVPLTSHLDAVGAAMLVAYSPDSLGLLGADFGQIGLRYRWATGEREPAFP